MRFESSRQPVLREQCIEKAEQESNRSAEGHQRIHIRGTVMRLLPGIYEENTSEPQHRHAKSQHQPRSPAIVHKNHAGHHQRQCKNPCSDRIAAQSAVMRLLGLLLLFSRMVFVDNQIVPDRAHRFLQPPGSHLHRIVLHVQQVRCKIYRGRLHAGNAPHHAFDAHCTRCATHLQYRKILFDRCHFIPSISTFYFTLCFTN